jgi:hypothetical protein
MCLLDQNAKAAATVCSATDRTEVISITRADMLRRTLFLSLPLPSLSPLLLSLCVSSRDYFRTFTDLCAVFEERPDLTTSIARSLAVLLANALKHHEDDKSLVVCFISQGYFLS